VARKADAEWPTADATLSVHHSSQSSGEPKLKRCQLLKVEAGNRNSLRRGGHAVSHVCSVLGAYTMMASGLTWHRD
jgi:hypothetical protein